MAAGEFTRSTAAVKGCSERSILVIFEYLAKASVNNCLMEGDDVEGVACTVDAMEVGGQGDTSSGSRWVNCLLEVDDVEGVACTVDVMEVRGREDTLSGSRRIAAMDTG